ncbi:MAG: aspartate kinase, partial [Muribaculaceae bacterium]|nr:aspartate kinase [Muribaculaceae bacterium]
MKVLKFGGTSVGSAERIMNVAKIIIPQGKNVIVLSAMSGVTNKLVEICGYIKSNQAILAEQAITSLSQKYIETISILFASDINRQAAAVKAMEESNKRIRSFIGNRFRDEDEKIVLAQGELISTMFMHLYLHSIGVNSSLLSALDFMRKSYNGEPDKEFISKRTNEVIERNAKADIYITQGFICRDCLGKIDNLERGGSDYTASLIGAAIKAEEIQIWTDIDGLHNNDPRYVENTTPVRQLSFDEASELAYFGAKILHPTCILPAKQFNIPVRLLNTMQPTAPGTLIGDIPDLPASIKAIAAKDNIKVISVKSDRLLLAYGFLHRVFEIFNDHTTAIDMICTSEVSVSVAIDNGKELDHIIKDLKKCGSVSVDEDMSIVCIVGNIHWNKSVYYTHL